MSALGTGGFAGQDVIDLTLNVPKGTFADAWGQGTSSTSNHTTNFDTAFTEAGWDNGSGSNCTTCGGN